VRVSNTVGEVGIERMQSVLKLSLRVLGWEGRAGAPGITMPLIVWGVSTEMGNPPPGSAVGASFQGH